MRQKLMPERISRTEERPLSKDDLAILIAKRNKQILFLLSGYLPFIAFGLYFWLIGPDSLNTGRSSGLWNDKINIDDKMKTQFWTVLPYFLAFGFIMLSIYFIKLYFQVLRPLNRDIWQNKKQFLFFKPAKNPMAFFNKYYISAPLYENQQVEISREDFDSIGDNDELCLEVAPESTFIFRLSDGNKQINYY